ncbi:MAG: hypothetical protein GX056_04760 [Synergistaceae bacterium]|nr:hypothetical protein [Synergistaceae bacterium]MCK9437648.1 hypothetical protein [Synergistaceae bacterium]MDD2351806.1 desulfoferrodoxin family protein [Synergistaceae bacterium]MDD3318952.1 desulfoferrodoxin family protein [Synergistaceae bacterium]MDD3673018.1 desulfoferrodoxin family protein [Synergistaceae bacterium]
MGKFVKLLLTLMAVILICTPIYAHPAEKIELKWDEAASVLDVSIVHPVKNTANHYISKIVVSVDGKEIEEKTLKSQSDVKTEHVLFEIKDLKKGSKIEVEATCNVFGKLKESMVL